MLGRLVDYENEYPPEVIQPAVEVLSEIEGRLREGQAGFGDPFGASTALRRVLFRLLRQAGEPPKPFEVIDRALLRINSLSAKALLISIVGTKRREVEIGTDTDKDRLLTVLGRQVTAVPTERLRHERRLGELLYIAKTYGNAEAGFFERILGDDELLLRFLSSMLTESFSMTMGDIVQEKREDLPWEQLQNLVGAELLRQRVLALASRNLNISDERARTALALAIKYAQGAQTQD